ncbi:MAG: SCO family protein [Candidatus Omnitrophota bacterium]
MIKLAQNKIFIFFSIFSVLVIAVVYQLSPQKKLPVLGNVVDFSLLDSTQKQVSLSNFKNKVWVANFFFTTCGSICPMMTQNMMKVYKRFLDDPDVHYVSISVNPEFDSPEILTRYAQKYGADPLKWHFLTGPRESIQELAVKGFKVGTVDEPVFHSSYFILIDKNANIRGYYDGITQKGVDQLTADIALLLKEK